MKKSLAFLFMGLFALCTNAQTENEMIKVATTEMSSLYSGTKFNTIAVHDPSVFWDDASKKFYIYGSHYCGASSTDLRNWSNWGMWGDYYNTKTDAYAAFKSNPTHTVKRCLPGSKTEEEVTLGSYNAADFCATYAGITVGDRQPTTAVEWIKGNQWAPDVIYNPNMKKYCYYLSLNGDNWASVVVLMTSNKITGPYTYEAPIVFSGFDGQTRTGKKVNYKDTDLELVLGEQKSLPSRYNTNKWGTYYPNCIDPCVFFDEEGEMWLTYGSWSGGIFMLKLDKKTGLRDYTYTYSGTGTSPVASQDDAYFGHHIAGGYYVSGEGSYVQRIGNYYYLFMSYGFFSPDGGYEMRVFRSDKPTGPYKDASGNLATYTGYQMNYGPSAATNRGMKLIGAMNHWGNMTVGECAQGHNSACVDDKGRAFLVCHTKFNNGTAGHSVRAYQLYTNKSGWLCTAPFQFAGETTTDETIASSRPWTAADVEGDYHVIIHPYKLDYKNMQEVTPSTIHLSAEGKVTGDYSGTWSFTDEGKSYFRIKLGNVTYDGVYVEQTLENNTAKTLCFTTVATSGVPAWGYKLHPKSAIAYNYLNHKNAFTMGSVSSHKQILFDPVENVDLTWTSSDPEHFSEDGKYNPDTVSLDVSMTGRLSCGNYYWETTTKAKLSPLKALTGDPYSGIVAYYDFNGTTVKNAYNEEQSATLQRANTTTGVKPTIDTDYARFGKVVHTYFGAQGSNSYVRMPNPLKDIEKLEGFTVSMWVKRTDANKWDALWSFFDSFSSKADGPRLFFTGNAYLGFKEDDNTWFDVNNPDKKVIDKITPGEWKHVTVTYSAANGYVIYVDGTKLYSTTFTGSTAKVTDFDHSKVLDLVSSAAYFYFGLGSFWGSADACFDDLLIYNRELTAADVKDVFNILNRTYDFTPEGVEKAVAIESVEMPAMPVAKQGIYDLQGRKVAAPGKGIYIVNGKKVAF